jgi:phosphatidylglycerophosphate synthase
MAARVNVPTLITLARLGLIFLMLACVLAYAPDRDYLRLAAVVLLLLAIASDLADGRIARYLGQETYIGAVLDSATDAVGFTLGFVVLAFVDTGLRFPLWLSAIVVLREVLVYGSFVYVLRRVGHIDKKTHWLGKLSTPLLALSILALFLRWEYAPALWAIAALFAIVSGLENLYGSWRCLKKAGNKGHSG